MGIDDRLSDKAEEIEGRIKETAGAAFNDDELEEEGMADQAKAKVKDLIEDVKDRVRRAKD